MAIPKALRFAVLLLVICFTLDQQRIRQSMSTFFEELKDTTSSMFHVREKRETLTNFTEYDFEVVITYSDLESIQMFLSNMSFPIPINNTVEITSIETTTVCSPGMNGYQCTCEESFAWSFNNCITYGVCDAILGNTCGCINSLPADGQYCQLNRSQTDPVESYVNIVVEIPASSFPSYALSYVRSTVQSISLPITLSQSLEVKEVYLTTLCNPYSADGHQCQCETGFSWPCDMCNSRNSCSSQSCTCIYGLPSNDEFCQANTNDTTCEPTPTTSTGT
ncbi:adhesion G protein-coupled receptor F5-like [Cyprinodon tularosa]|uniref:adhesion G protein-coupled receptor F5-like n=1 Tax=Cyprinodon tularosa TaxID=77115 RepID=UPI0018E1F87D|nr:adhesion G protein-coupled receptor F5-like [Cyprinodon tularosa]